MSKKQKTIRKAVTLSGKGLHTGLQVDVTFRPAPENHGYVFKRIDLENQPLIRAVAENVVDTARGTTIAENGVKIGTIEHLMASLYGQEIDNVLLEINGPEAPIIDGSAKFVVRALKEAGIVDQEQDKNYYKINEKISYSDPDKNIDISIYPDDKFSVDVMIDYNSRVLGNQYATLSDLRDFENEIAPCRTFVFFHELEFLLKNNLIKGGDLENAIVILENEVPQDELDRIADLFNKPRIKRNSEGVMNNLEMYYSNEPARHKLLDLLGDLSLIGRPIKGRIVATRPGHLANNLFSRKICSIIRQEETESIFPEYDISGKPLLNVQQIMNLLPHRPPFLLVDKIVAMTETTIVGVKNVTMNEGFFIGHFPDEPIMPGVLQVEAMAQVGGILVLSSVPDPENYATYFLKIDRVKFKRKVIPGDTLIFKLQYMSPLRRGIVHMRGQAFVGNELAMEGEMMAQIRKTKLE
jgi:UDP-3-O-[3-hydroxymyristoyl] N-acetylglucosamine deacetylase / 3-hydroxyacyl-[acyl-carrier-protein] dehydratase